MCRYFLKLKIFSFSCQFKSPKLWIRKHFYIRSFEYFIWNILLAIPMLIKVIGDHRVTTDWLNNRHKVQSFPLKFRWYITNFMRCIKCTCDCKKRTLNLSELICQTNCLLNVHEAFSHETKINLSIRSMFDDTREVNDDTLCFVNCHNPISRCD